MKYFLLTISLAFLFFSTSCDRWVYYCDKPSFECTERMQVKDLTGLDGCGLVLETEEGDHLEAVNLNDFGITIEDGMWVDVGYEVVEDAASICMVGPIVRLHCLNKVENPVSPAAN